MRTTRRNWVVAFAGTMIAALLATPGILRANDVSASVTVSGASPPPAVGFNEPDHDGLNWTDPGDNKRLKVTLNAPPDKRIKCSTETVTSEGIAWDCATWNTWQASHLYTSALIMPKDFFRPLFSGTVEPAAGAKGPAPKWEAGVIQADIQGDADNDCAELQRPPATADAERKQEEVHEQGKDGNGYGLMMPENRDYHESDPENEDNAHAGIVITDPDLVKAKLILKLPDKVLPDSKVKLTYDSSTVKVYKPGTPNSPIASGAQVLVSTFGVENELLVEGIAACVFGYGAIEVTLTPKTGDVSRDELAVTVLDVDLDLDSNNNNTEDYNAAEDKIDNKPAHCGMLVPIDDTPDEVPPNPPIADLKRGRIQEISYELMHMYEIAGTTPEIFLRKLEGPGDVRVYKADGTLLVDTSVGEGTSADLYTELQSGGPIDLRVMGLTLGKVVLILEVIVNDDVVVASDKVKINFGLDLDVDSDNADPDADNTLLDRSDAEDLIEDSDSLVGKLIPVNDDNDDVNEGAGDDVIDHTDGFDKNGTAGDNDDRNVVERSFQPIVLEIPEGIDPTKANVKFTYWASDPKTAGQPFPPATTYLRLWKTKNRAAGAVSRDKKSVADDGDYIPGAKPGDAEIVFTLDKLGFTGGTSPVRTVSFWIEAVAPASAADPTMKGRILVEVDPDGTDQDYEYILKDAVRVTAFKVEVVRHDLTEAGELVPLYRPEPLIRIPDLPAGPVAGDTAELTAANCQAYDTLTFVNQVEVSDSGNGGGWVALPGGFAAETPPGTAGNAYESRFNNNYVLTGLNALRDQPLGTRRRWLFRATNILGLTAYEELILEVRVNPGTGAHELHAINLGPAEDATPPTVPTEKKHKIVVTPAFTMTGDPDIITLSRQIYTPDDNTGTLLRKLTEINTDFVFAHGPVTLRTGAAQTHFYPHFRMDYSGAETHLLRVECTPVDDPAPDVDVTAEDNVTAVSVDLDVFLSDESLEKTDPITIRRNPTAVTTANFEQYKFLMRPMRLHCLPNAGIYAADGGEVRISREAGTDDCVTLWRRTQAGTWVSADLPLTLDLSSYNEAVTNVRFRINGTQYGTAQLNVEHTYKSVVINKDEITLRVRDLPGLAGENITGHPHFNYVNTFTVDGAANVGETIRAALDPFLYPHLCENKRLPAGGARREVDVYIVPHRESPAAWTGAGNTLNDATPGGHLPDCPLDGRSILQNRWDAWPNVAAAAPRQAVREYDIVVDITNDAGEDVDPDGRLDPGDLVFSFGPTPEPEAVVLDHPETITAYPNSAFVEYRFSDYWQAGARLPDARPGEDIRVRLRARIQYPTGAAPIMGTTTPVVLGTGNGTVGALALNGGAENRYWEGVYIQATGGGPGDWYFRGSGLGHVTQAAWDAPNTRWNVDLRRNPADAGTREVTFQITQGATAFATGDRIILNVAPGIAVAQNFPVVTIVHGMHGAFRVTQPKFFDLNKILEGDWEARLDDNCAVYNVSADPGNHYVVITRQAAGNWQAAVDGGAPGAAFGDNTRQTVALGVGQSLDVYIRPSAVPGLAYAAGDYFLIYTQSTVGTMTPDENYRGYGRSVGHAGDDYLMEHLARNGFVAVSVSMDDLHLVQMPPFPGAWTGSIGGIHERARIINEHVTRLRNNTPLQAGAPATAVLTNLGLNGRLDLNLASLVGHSRGGEAVVYAANLTTGPAYRTVAAIAPVHFSSVDLLVPHLPFLGIYGSHDGDVVTGGAFQIYDRGTSHEKQIVYLTPANHNYFNRSWAENWIAGAAGDDLSGNTNGFNGAGGAAAARRAIENVAKGYIMAFLAANVNRPDLGGGQAVPAYPAYKDFFRRASRSFRLPMIASAASVHLQHLDPTGRLNVDDYETQPHGQTPNELGEAVTVVGRRFDTYAENPLEFQFQLTDGPPVDEDARFHQWTFAEQLGWNRPAINQWPVYDTALAAAAGARDVSGYRTLSFRAGQTFGSPGSGADLSVTVQLIDADGKEATIEGIDFSPITHPVDRPPAGPSPLGSPDPRNILYWRAWDKGHFVTLRVPLWAFRTDGRDVDLTRVRTMRIVCDDARRQGTVALDDIMFGN